MFVGALKMKTFVESQQKQTMGLILNIKNCQFLNWSLPTEEIFQTHGKNRPVTNLPVADRFFISAIRNATTKATEYVTFGFLFSYFGFLPFVGKFERHCL